jgi:acetylornithine deacetylase/succinyl-diaminopimelate desuccinylase-like protein
MKIHRFFLALAAFAALGANAQSRTPEQEKLVDIYRELIETYTGHPDGDTAVAARKMAKRLIDAGFDPADVEVTEIAPHKGNVVARLRGTGERKPVLLLAHLDVVAANKEDWSDNLDPFKLTERDGYFYGRGTIDDKAMGAIFVANLIRLKREGFRGKRDIVVALTADEESGGDNGVAWLIAHRRSTIDAEMALNEGGGGTWHDGKPFLNGVQVSEKMYQSFAFEATSAGGHSSLPGRENAIYDLARALERLSAYELPPHITTATRRYFAAVASGEETRLGAAMSSIARGNPSVEDLRTVSAVPRFNAQLRTTCVATRIEGGHADNALPARARAVVNCRELPDEDPAFVQSELQRIAGDKVKVTPMNEVRRNKPADPDSPAMKTIERVSQSMWPGTPVVPVMSAGATDGSRLLNAGIAVYGTSGIFMEQGENRMHGRDERVPVRSLFEGQEYLYRLTKALAED